MVDAAPTAPSVSASAAATATSYVGQLAVIAMWLDGAIESGSWHLTYEVVTIGITLSVQVAHNLSPLWRAALKKFFGYDPYETAKALLPLLLVFGLSACSATPKADIAALEVTLTVADKAATGYVKLPRCPQPAGMCSDDDIVSRIGSYRLEAYQTVTTARSVVNAATSSVSDISKAMAAAQAALTGYEQIVGGLP